jgi:diguanylate cyclase
MNPVDPPSLLNATQHLAAYDLAYAAGQAEVAMRHAIEAGAKARDQADTALQADALLKIAALNLDADALDEAISVLEQARPLVDAQNDPKLMFRLLNLLGNALGAAKDHEGAIAQHESSLELAVAHGLERAQAVARNNLAAKWLNLGEDQFEQGSAESARAAWQRAAAMFGDLSQEPQCQADATLGLPALTNLGSVLQLLGQTDEALAAVEAADAMADKASAKRALGNIFTRARVYLQQGRIELARQAAQAGIAESEARQRPMVTANLHLFLCDLEAQAGRPVEALAHHKKFHALSAATVSAAATARSRMLAVQLQTERALAEAATEKAHRSRLQRENASLSKQAEHLSLQAQQDPLTGLANRRRLDAHLAANLAEAQARALPQCVAMLDVDHFKAVNDTYSHGVGDRVLQRLGQLLQAQCRSDDLAARYGGEEFTIVFGQIGLVRAQAVCERLRASIEAHDWTTVAPGLGVTVSIGVCDISTRSDADQGLAAADALLYRAKAEGRNRVVAGA